MLHKSNSADKLYVSYCRVYTCLLYIVIAMYTGFSVPQKIEPSYLNIFHSGFSIGTYCYYVKSPWSMDSGEIYRKPGIFPSKMGKPVISPVNPSQSTWENPTYVLKTQVSSAALLWSPAVFGFFSSAGGFSLRQHRNRRRALGDLHT